MNKVNTIFKQKTSEVKEYKTANSHKNRVINSLYLSVSAKL